MSRGGQAAGGERRDMRPIHSWTPGAAAARYFVPACIWVAATAAAAATAALVEANNRTLDIPGRLQWPDRDGYCGSATVQMNALNFGSWVSQGVVRAAVGAGECGGGGDGNEVLHTNAACVLEELRFNHTDWDYHNEPRPQAKGYLLWLKQNLARGHPVIMFIFCKGDSHRAHGSEPGYGHYDHIEPVVGILSNHSLEEGSGDLNTYYDDDILVHHSDWSQDFYYRTFASMPDGPWMLGNCRDAPSRGGGPNEAYPCIPKDIDYGYAMTGRFDPQGIALPVHLAVDSWTEPDIVEGQRPKQLTGTVTVRGLEVGHSYEILRFDGYTTVPLDGDFAAGNYTEKHAFKAKSPIYKWVDPLSIDSSGSTYYYCIPLA